MDELQAFHAGDVRTPEGPDSEVQGSSREALLYEECAAWTPLNGHYYHDNKLRTVHHRMMMIIMTT